MEAVIEERAELIRRIYSASAEGSLQLVEETDLAFTSRHAAMLHVEGGLALHAFPSERIYDAEPQWYYTAASPDTVVVTFHVPPVFRRGGQGRLSVVRHRGMTYLIDQKDGVNPWEKYERELRLVAYSTR